VCFPLGRLRQQLRERFDELGQSLRNARKHLRRHLALCQQRLFPQFKTSFHDGNLLNGSLFRKLHTKSTYTPLCGFGQ
jgi:hypothetical protein